MIKKIKVTDHPRLMEIWESSVLNTHDFLKEEDFLYYKEQLPVYFQHVTLFGFEQEGILIGFMGIAEGNLEMLFIDNNYRGIGIGKKLITYAIDNLQVTKVDVNEQNNQPGFPDRMLPERHRGRRRSLLQRQGVSRPPVVFFSLL